MLVIGLVVVRRQAGAEGYFLAGRQLRWPFIGASMFASNISAEHFVGLAGSGFAIGMAIGGFEWMAVYCIVPLVVLFLPFYVRNRIYTVPEFLERRFSPGVRLLFSGLMVVALGADEGLDLAVGLVDRLLRHPRLAAALGDLGRRAS